MALREQKYKPNQTIVSLLGYGENIKIRLVTMKSLRTSGIECDDEIKSERGSVNDEKLEQSICRTKRMIFELAFCNPWDWFFTGTLDKTKYDRTDLNKFHKDLTQWIRDYNKKYNLKIKFLFVPEKHSDGQNWHIHGFLYGLPMELLSQFKIGDKMGKNLAQKVINGDKVYNWVDYQKKFGFNDLEPIRTHEGVSKYITKYINKELVNSVTELNAHKYYHSRGLKVAEVIKKGTMYADIEPDYVGDYCTITTLDYSPEKVEEILGYFY